MTSWVVDGNNVYGSRPDGWWRDRAGAAARLAAAVDRWQRSHGEPVVVFFDGRPTGDLLALDRQGFAVRFAERAGRDAADDAIVRHVEDVYADEPDLRVVTADRGLIDRLPPGVGIERPRSFLDRLAAS